jgi:hypothetical protein
VIDVALNQPDGIVSRAAVNDYNLSRPKSLGKERIQKPLDRTPLVLYSERNSNRPNLIVQLSSSYV